MNQHIAFKLYWYSRLLMFLYTRTFFLIRNHWISWTLRLWQKPFLIKNFGTKFQLTMHQNRWWLGLRPRPHWGSLRRSPRPPSRIGSRYALALGRFAPSQWALRALTAGASRHRALCAAASRRVSRDAFHHQKKSQFSISLRGLWIIIKLLSHPDFYITKFYFEKPQIKFLWIEPKTWRTLR